MLLILALGRQVGISEFDDGLAYIVSSRSARIT